MLIILNNSGIEVFNPKINTQSLEHQGCEVDMTTEPTNDKNKNNLVHSIVANGYKLKLKNNEMQYIKKSLVKVYEYKSNDNSINNINSINRINSIYSFNSIKSII